MALESSSISGSIYFSGLGNGTDFSSVIEQLKEIESIPKKRLESWKSDWQARYDAFGLVLDAVQEAKSTLSGLNSRNKFVAKTVSSSDDSIVSAKATAEAVDGHHSIKVLQLASNAIWANTGANFEEKNAVFNTSGTSQKFSYSYKGVEHEMMIPPNTTLDGFANMVNNDAQNPGIRVSIVRTGDGYSYQISGQDAGKDASLIVHAGNLEGMSGGTGTWKSSAFDPSDGLYDSYTYKVKLASGKEISFQLSGEKTTQDLVDKLASYTSIKAEITNGELALEGVLSVTRQGMGQSTPTTLTTACTGGISLDTSTGNPPQDYALFNDSKVTLTGIDGNDITLTLEDPVTGGASLAAAVNNAYKKIKPGASDVASFTDGKLAFDGMIGVTFEDAASPTCKDWTFSSSFKTGVLYDGLDADAVKAQPLGEGAALEYTVVDMNGNTTTVSLARGTGNPAMQDLFTAIKNKFPAATLETGADGKSRIVLPDASSISGPGLSGGMTDSSNWAMREACDAEFQLDNWPQTLTSSTNTISDVVDGMTITLKSTGNVELSVATDPESVTKSIQTVLDSINNVLKTIQTLSSSDKQVPVDSEGKELIGSYSMQGSALTGNYGVQLLTSRLKTLMSGSPPGFTAGDGTAENPGDPISTLSQMGIKICAVETDPYYGLLTIAPTSSLESMQTLDQQSFDVAMSKQLEAVLDFFAASNEGSSTSPDFRYANHITGMAVPGSYEVSYKVSDDGKISDVFIGGEKATQDTSMQGNWFSCSSGDVRSLAIQIDNLTPGEHSGTVSIREGFVGTMESFFSKELRYSKFDPENNGSLRVMQENYQDIMDNIQAKIEKEAIRIANWETREKARFSRLEKLLSEYEGKQSSLNSLASSLSSSSSSS